MIKSKGIIPLLLSVFFLSIVGYILQQYSKQHTLSLAPHLQEMLLNRYKQQFRDLSLNDIYREIPVSDVEKYYDLIGPEEMLSVVDENPLCHLQGHNIGKVIFKRTQNLTKSFEICQDKCSTSCFHGVLMESFKSDNNGHISLNDLKQNAIKLCNGNVSTYNISNGSCMHAIGHAAMHLADYDIPSALGACALFDKPLEQYQCATGAYMERDLYYGAEDAKKEDLYPCKNSPFSVACYTYRVKYLKQNNTPEQIINTCLAIENTPDEVGCFFGVGYAYLISVIEDPSYIQTICSLGNENDRLACIDGSVGTIGIVQPDKAREACNYVTENEKKHCLESAQAGQTLEVPDLSIYGIE